MDHLNGHNILLVDDDSEQAPIIKQLLETSITKKITVFWYKNGVAALEFLAVKTSPTISLVLLETQNTNFDGISVLKQLKDVSSPHRIIPVIIFSRSKDLPRIKQCFSLGANSWVRKSSDSNRLKKNLEAILEFWLIHAILPSTLT